MFMRVWVTCMSTYGGLDTLLRLLIPRQTGGESQNDNTSWAERGGKWGSAIKTAVQEDIRNIMRGGVFFLERCFYVTVMTWNWNIYMTAWNTKTKSFLTYIYSIVPEFILILDWKPFKYSSRNHNKNVQFITTLTRESLSIVSSRRYKYLVTVTGSPVSYFDPMYLMMMNDDICRLFLHDVWFTLKEVHLCNIYRYSGLGYEMWCIQSGAL